MSKVKEFYNKHSEYQKQYAEGKQNARLQYIGHQIDSIMTEHSIESVLEIGCGVGITAERFLNWKCKVTGVDISTNNIDFCTTNHPTATWIEQDFLTLSSARFSEKFDCITLFDIIEHFPVNSEWRLWNKIADFSHQDTLVLINIPDYHFSEKYYSLYPQQKQVIENPISAIRLMCDAELNYFKLIKFQSYGLEYENQYNFMVFQPFKNKLKKIWKVI